LSTPSVSALSPDQRPPLLKKCTRASSDTSGLVKKKNTTMSMIVDRPSANAKPRTTPAAKM
jgi:hypothetical protein